MKVRDGAGVVHESGNGVPNYMLSVCGRLAFDSVDVGKVDDDTPTTCLECIAGAQPAQRFATIEVAGPPERAVLKVLYADGTVYTQDHAALHDHGGGQYSVALPPCNDTVSRVVLEVKTTIGLYAFRWDVKR